MTKPAAQRLSAGARKTSGKPETSLKERTEASPSQLIDARIKELKDWRGNRADAGRIAQGLPKNNKFRGAPSGGKATEDE